MMHVRRLARREVARGALLSDDPAWRSVQLRFLGVGLFLALSFLALAHGKLLRLFGTVVVVPEVLLGVLVLALVVWSRVKAQRPPAEPVDVELELSAADVERRLLEDLRPSDLIYERERWMTLLESAQFGDAAAVPQQALERRARAAMVVMVALGLVVFAALATFLFNFADILLWLSKD